MIIPTTGYSEVKKMLGGRGLLSVKLSSSTGLNRLICKFVSGNGSDSSHLGLGGFRIGTEIFNGKRVLHVYHPSIVVEEINPSVIEGLPLEVACGLSGNALICDHDASPVSSPSPSEKSISIGGSYLSKTSNDHLYVKDKGNPEEEAEFILGSMLIKVGRFGDNWAIGIKKST
jgi:hypothetical protein